MIMLKVTKSQGFTLSLEDTFFENHKGRVKFFIGQGLLVESLLICQSNI